MSNRAWVTLATNDSYGLGALVLAHSLRRNGSTYPAVVLITPSVTDAMRDRLSAVFSEVITVDVLDSKDATHLALLQRPELGITFTKIHCWNLTQFEKCVFLDADTLVVQNCDELFEKEELSAAPDVGWPDCFNSGVFVFKPSAETFSRLVTFAKDRGSFDGGDQGLLNSFFSDWARGDINNHLPFLYNVTSAAFYSYIPALKHYGQNLKIIHFIGATKPWLQQFNWDSKSVNAPDHLKEFLQLWWDIFVGQVHQQLDTTMVEVDQETTEATPEVPQEDVLQYYAPTLDPESEFPWHHPDENATNLEENTFNLDPSNFYDPWEHRRGDIPPSAKSDPWQQSGPEFDNSCQSRQQWEQQQYSQSEQSHHHFELSSTDSRQSQNAGPSHCFHGEQQHWGHHSIQNHDQQTHRYESQDEQNNSHKLNTDSYYEFTHDNYNQEVPNHEHYSEHEHSYFHHQHDHLEHSHNNHHQENLHQSYHHDQHEHSHVYHHTDHHHHSHTEHQYDNDQVINTSDNFSFKKLSNHTSEHTHSNQKSPTHFLAHLKQKQPQYVYCVHLDHSKSRKNRQNNLKRVEITVTKEMMDEYIADEETEDCDDIIPRHPYDGFYLRHRVTINSRGKKVCTHEIPPIPSPPTTPTVDKVHSSDTPELLLDVDSAPINEDSSSVVSQEQTGVAGNLARVAASPVDAQREAIDELARRQGWEAGNIDYMGADSFDNIWAKISETLNQPRASPTKEPEAPPTSKEQVALAVEPSSQPIEVAAEAASDPIPVQSEPPQTPIAPEPKQEDVKTAEGIKTIKSPSELTVTESKPVEPEVKAKAIQEIETAVEVKEAPVAELRKSDEAPKHSEAPQAAEGPKITETSATVEESKPVEAERLAEIPKLYDVSKPIEPPKPTKIPQTADVPKTIEVPKLAEVSKPAEEPKVAEVPKPAELPKSVETPQAAAVSTFVEAPKPAVATRPVTAPKPSEPSKPVQPKSPEVEVKKTEPLAVPPTPPTSPKSTPELDSPSESSIPEPVKIAEASLASEIAKEAPVLQQSSDSPPLANTPSKEDVPSAPAAKSEEKRRPAGKLRLSPPQGAPALPTPDSEAEDAATLAHAIIAGELTPQPPDLTTSPVGPTSLAQIGVKPKTKPSTADCIESSVSEVKQSEHPKKKVVKKVVKKDATGAEAPVPPPRKKEKKPKDK